MVAIEHQLQVGGGDVADHVDDVIRARPEAEALAEIDATGPATRSIVQLETGLDDPPMPFPLDREIAEEIFRLAATESRADRAHNPGLPSSEVDTVLAALCTVVAVMRRLGLERISLSTSGTR